MSTKSTIKDLVQTLEDGAKGFTDAADKLADDGHQNIADRFRGFAQQRQTFSSELRRIAGEQGMSIDEDGSIGGALHRGWMGMKDALTGTDRDAVLNAAESGEDHAVKEYDKALDSDDLPAPVATEVRRQADEIRTTRDQVKSLSSS